jgi:malate/lactate dehydrogenase
VIAELSQIALWFHLTCTTIVKLQTISNISVRNFQKSSTQTYRSLTPATVQSGDAIVALYGLLATRALAMAVTLDPVV